MQNIDDLKISTLRDVLAQLTLDNLLDLEQITLDLLEHFEEELEKLAGNPDVFFDLELTLEEMKGKCRRLSKATKSEVDLKVLNYILKIDYNYL